MPIGLPKPSDISFPPSPLSPIKGFIRKGSGQIKKARSDIRSLANEMGELSSKVTGELSRDDESHKEALISDGEYTSINEIKKGTACLPCSRDHLSTSSSALSEGVRFARENGVKNAEVVRRLRIAIDELNIMERIDLAPSETTQLKGKEKETANWVLGKSRELRHDITAISSPEDMERVAAKAADVTEAFMGRLFQIREDEGCPECAEMKESLKSFLDSRRKKTE